MKKTNFNALKTGLVLFVLFLNFEGGKMYGQSLLETSSSLITGDVLFYNGNTGGFTYEIGPPPSIIPTRQFDPTTLKYDVSTGRFNFGNPSPKARLDFDEDGLGFFSHEPFWNSSSGQYNNGSITNHRFDIRYKNQITSMVSGQAFWGNWEVGAFFSVTNGSNFTNEVMFFGEKGNIGFGNAKPKAQVHIWNDGVTAKNEFSLTSDLAECLLVGPHTFASTSIGQGTVKSSGTGAGFSFLDRSKTADLIGASSTFTGGDWFTWLAKSTSLDTHYR